MITFQAESFTAAIPELQDILQLHYKELAMNQDKVPLSPSYDVYSQQEEAGRLIFVTLRDEGVIKGYFIGFIDVGLHYNTCLTCNMDIFYIHPEIRGAGAFGLKLFRAVEQELRGRGVQRWLVGSKIKADASALFKRIGFEPIEVYHSKWIGD